jgi:undecaprenyl-phosphate 4-deoxy-4-formamido-L-arabinose transferase
VDEPHPARSGTDSGKPMPPPPPPHGGPPELSVVIPVLNEEAVLDELFARLFPVLDGLDTPYEVICVDDGSTDGSVGILRRHFQARSAVLRLVILRANAGQHAAVLAGFSVARGRYAITMDADLQNPPEEIPRILSRLREGYDYVGTVREERKDRRWRHAASRAMNYLREWITDIRMTDQGSMMRGYHRDIVDLLVKGNEGNTFIPALGYLYAADPVEITISHGKRFAGESKYSLFKLIQLNFDLITSFSTIPLQAFSLIGMVVSTLSFLFVVYLAIRRLIIGPEAEGVFTLFAIAFFLIGLLLFAIGLLGEYLVRVYGEVRNRPLYTIAAIVEHTEDAPDRAATDD